MRLTENKTNKTQNKIPTFYTSHSCTCCLPWDRRRRRTQQGSPGELSLDPKTNCL